MAFSAATPSPASEMQIQAVPFSVTDSATWPVLLTAEHVAAIWGLSVKRVNLLARTGAFPGPAPLDGTPRRWRKCDVQRFAERKAS